MNKIWVGSGVALALVILVWPVGTWLQCRERQELGSKADAVYILAGARHQDIRLDALRHYLENVEKDDDFFVLVGRNPMEGRWSREQQRNLKMHEWSVYEIQKMLNNQEKKSLQVVVVPGKFSGTDGEMEALSKFVDEKPDIQELVLVSSSFHLRRSVKRLNEYMNRHVSIAVVASGSWADRMPWTVLLELGKMGRDRLGLSRNPLLSRE